MSYLLFYASTTTICNGVANQVLLFFGCDLWRIYNRSVRSLQLAVCQSRELLHKSLAFCGGIFAALCCCWDFCFWLTSTTPVFRYGVNVSCHEPVLARSRNWVVGQGQWWIDWGRVLWDANLGHVTWSSTDRGKQRELQIISSYWLKIEHEEIALSTHME